MTQNNPLSTIYSRTALGIVGSLIFFSPMARGAVHPWAYTLIQIGVILSAMCLVLESLTQPKINIVWAPMGWPIVGVILLSLVSFAASEYKPFALEGLFMMLIYGTAYLTTHACIRTEKEHRILVHVIVLTAVFLCLIGLLKRFDILTPGWWSYPDVGLYHGANAVSGPYVNRNHLAGFLEMVIPFAMALIFTRHRTREQELGLMLVALLLVTTQAFTLSRGGWISTITALLFMVSVYLTQNKTTGKKTLAAVMIGFLVISLFVLSSLPAVERIITLTQQEHEDNLSGRMRCWKGTIKMIKENFLFGTGPDTFTEAYPAWQVPGPQVLRRKAHNDYLHYLSETGIFLIPVGAVTLYCFFRIGFKHFHSPSRQERGFTLAAMAGVLAILIHSLSDANLNIPANAFVFIVLAGIIRE